MRRQAFSAFLFQVIGNNHVLLAAIKHPVFSAAQPDCSFQWPAAMLQHFMDAWEEEKTTGAYKKRVMIFQRRTKQQEYLKKRSSRSTTQPCARPENQRRHHAGRQDLG